MKLPNTPTNTTTPSKKTNSTTKTRVPNSGIKKGYKYEYLTKNQKLGQEKTKQKLTGREISWADKIAETYADNPEMASKRNKDMWKKRRATYICTDPWGREYRTVNLTNFCKRHGLSVSHMSRISRWKIDGGPLGGSRYHKKWDVRRVKHRDGR